MRVRMKDIAADLGLSIVTISKVLRDHPDISEETRDRVLQRVKELRYQPNVMARSLVTGRSYLIGLVVPDLLHPFFAEVAVSISKTIRKRGYSLIIVSCEEDSELEELEIEQMVARRLDGLIIASSRKSTELFDRLDEQKQPFVLIDRRFDHYKANFVGTDDVMAGRLATEHLLSIGCKRIAHIRGRDNSTGADRLDGYKQALDAAGLPFQQSHVIMRDTVDIDSRRQGAEAAKRILALKPRPDGIFCYNDPMAIGAIDTILGVGLAIPGDIAVIGCGNLHYDDSLRIPLSSIDQRSDSIGEHAGKMILKLVEPKTAKQKVTAATSGEEILTPKLVIRASTTR
jgi:LacI family transcriptional regulator